MQHQLEMEGTIRSQMEQETDYLQDQLEECVRQNGELEKEALELRYQMMTLQGEHCGHHQQQLELKQFQQVKAPPTNEPPF